MIKVINKIVKKAALFIARPSVPVMCINWFITIVGAVGCAAITGSGYEGAAAYAVFAVTFVSLAWSVYSAVRFAPSLKNRIGAVAEKYNFTRALTSDYAFRTSAFGFLAMVINLGFVVFNCAYAIVVRSGWYAATGAYYFLLMCLRAFIFFGNGRAERKEGVGKNAAKLRLYRMCGVAVLLLEAAAAAAVTLTIEYGKPVKYGEIAAITYAAYSVYKITLSVVNAVKAKGMRDAAALSFRCVGLADAAMSIVSLTVALNDTFGGEMMFLRAAVGFTVCAATVAMGIAMIISANIRLRRIDGAIDGEPQGDNNG